MGAVDRQFGKEKGGQPLVVIGENTEEMWTTYNTIENRGYNRTRTEVVGMRMKDKTV